MSTVCGSGGCLVGGWGWVGVGGSGGERDMTVVDTAIFVFSDVLWDYCDRSIKEWIFDFPLIPFL